MATEKAGYVADIVGFVAQPCPQCAQTSDEIVCGVCGWDSSEPQMTKIVRAELPDFQNNAGSDYHVSALDSDVCECGADKVIMGGMLQCPDCGDLGVLTPLMKNEKAVTISAQREEPEIAAPECKNPECDEKTKFDIIGGEFVCVSCGLSAGLPTFHGTQTNSVPPESASVVEPNDIEPASVEPVSVEPTSIESEPIKRGRGRPRKVMAQ